MRKQESLKNRSQSQVVGTGLWLQINAANLVKVLLQYYCGLKNPFDRNTNVLSMSVIVNSIEIIHLSMNMNFNTFMYIINLGLSENDWKCLSIGESCFLLNLPFGNLVRIDPIFTDTIVDGESHSMS